MLQIAIGGGIGCFGDTFGADHHGVRRWISCILIVCGMDGLTEN